MRKSAQTVIRPDAYYTIAAANGRVLEVADFNTENGASVRLWSYEGQPWQQWQFVEAGDGEYRIRNRFTGKVMDLAMSGVCNGTWSTSGPRPRARVSAGRSWRQAAARSSCATSWPIRSLTWWECAWRTAPRPRSGRMSLARTSSGSSTLCPSAC